MSIVRHEEQHSTALAIEADQTTFTGAQVAALRQIGVEEATDGDLQVFFHVAKRSGLDPFARQIHMVGRRSRNQRTNDWEMKYTIQVGIDGYRLIGRRAADRARATISMDPVEWSDRDGRWRDVWNNAWGTPLAARITIRRNGEPFPAIALFDEYAQTNRDGKLTSMWAQRPAGQIAKCAEALAWREAFPQDLAGIYTDEEMGQADNYRDRPAPSAPAQSALRSVVQAHQAAPEPQVLAPDPSPVPDTAVSVQPAPPTNETPPDESSRGQASTGEAPLLNTSSSLARAMYAAIREAGIPKENVHDLFSEVTGRTITSSRELTEDEARKVLDFLPQPLPVAPTEER